MNTREEIEAAIEYVKSGDLLGFQPMLNVLVNAAKNSLVLQDQLNKNYLKIENILLHDRLVSLNAENLKLRSALESARRQLQNILDYQAINAWDRPKLESEIIEISEALRQPL